MSRIRDIANILSGVSTDMATDAEVSSSIASHAAAADPHAIYLKESEYIAAGKNKILNGDFAINQRSMTSTSSAFAFLADRWQTVTWSGTGTWEIVNIADNSFAYQNSNKALRITSTSSANDHGFQQTIENVRTLAGQTVTISFWARCSSGTYNIDLVEILQNFGVSGSQNVYTYADVSNKTITTAWQRITFTMTVPSVNGKTIGANNYVNLRVDPTVTMPNGLWIEITHVQLESGNIATPFTTATGNPASELAACQRYYATSIPDGYTSSNFPIMGTPGSGGVIFTCSQGSTNDLLGNIQYPVPMRSTPSLSIFSGNNRTSGAVRDMVTGSDLTPANIGVQSGQNKNFTYMSGLTATLNRHYGFHYIASAEL